MAGQRKTLYRRDFLKVATGGVAGLVASRSAAAQTPEAAPAASSAGKTIRVLVTDDPFQYALGAIKDQFTAQTGINIIYEILKLGKAIFLNRFFRNNCKVHINKISFIFKRFYKTFF